MEGGREGGRDLMHVDGSFEELVKSPRVADRVDDASFPSSAVGGGTRNINHLERAGEREGRREGRKCERMEGEAARIMEGGREGGRERDLPQT